MVIFKHLWGQINMKFIEEYWRYYFHIYHAVVERRVYIWQVCVSRADLKDIVSLYIKRWSNTELEHVKMLAVDMDDYFDPKIIILDQVFIAWLMSLLLEIILGRLVIFHIYFIWLLEEEKHESESEWVECVVILWVYVYTLFSGVYTVFYKPCWWEYMLSELCNGKLIRDYTGCVICRRGDLVKGFICKAMGSR